MAKPYIGQSAFLLISTALSIYLHALLQRLRDLFLRIGHQNGCLIDLRGMNLATLMSRVSPREVFDCQ